MSATFHSLYSHDFLRVGAAVARVEVGDPLFNLAATLELARKADAEAGVAAGGADAPQSYTSPAPEAEGTLATDEALQALRDKLTGN